MQLLPKWVLTNKFPSVYDSEAKTVLEQTARIYGAMNDLITEYNAFADRTNQLITEFTAAATQNQEQFEIALRQEFQDFIDVIEINVQQQQAQIDGAVSYMRDNIISTTSKIINDSIRKGEIVINTVYDPNSENLNIVAGSV
jgi:predicted  nucleic acid-binding Zn-ribbon protein